MSSISDEEDEFVRCCEEFENIHVGGHIEDPPDVSEKVHKPGPFKQGQELDRELVRVLVKDTQLKFRKAEGTPCILDDMKIWINKHKPRCDIYVTVKEDGHFKFFDGNNQIINKSGVRPSFFVRRKADAEIALLKRNVSDEEKKSLFAQGSNEFSVNYNVENVNREYYKTVTGYLKRLSSLVECEYINQLKTKICEECKSPNSSTFPTWKEIDEQKISGCTHLEMNDRQDLKKVLESLKEIDRNKMAHKNGTKYQVCNLKNIQAYKYWENHEYEKYRGDIRLKHAQDYFVSLQCEMCHCKRDTHSHYTIAQLDEELKQKDPEHQLRYWARCIKKCDGEERYQNFRAVGNKCSEFVPNNRFFHANSIGFGNAKKPKEPNPFTTYDLKPKAVIPKQMKSSNDIDDYMIVYKIFDMLPTFPNWDKFALPFIDRMRIVDKCITDLNNMIVESMSNGLQCAWYQLPIVNVVPVLPVKITTYEQFLQLARVAFDKNAEGLIVCTSNKTVRNNVALEAKCKFKYLFDIQLNIKAPSQNERNKREGSNAPSLFQKTEPLPGKTESSFYYVALEGKPTMTKKGVYDWEYYGSYGAKEETLHNTTRKLNLQQRTIGCLYKKTIECLQTRFDEKIDTNDDGEFVVSDVWIRTTSHDNAHEHARPPRSKKIRDMWIPKQQRDTTGWKRIDPRKKAPSNNNKIIKETYACNHDNLWDSKIVKPLMDVDQPVQGQGDVYMSVSDVTNHEDEDEMRNSDTDVPVPGRRRLRKKIVSDDDEDEPNSSTKTEAKPSSGVSSGDGFTLDNPYVIQTEEDVTKPQYKPSNSSIRDGNCLYDAVMLNEKDAFQNETDFSLNQTDWIQSFRGQVADWLDDGARQMYYKQQVCSTTDSMEVQEKKWNDYLKEIRTPGKWAEIETIDALVCILNVPIVVHEDLGGNLIDFQERTKRIFKPKGYSNTKSESEWIHITFVPGHYDLAEKLPVKGDVDMEEGDDESDSGRGDIGMKEGGDESDSEREDVKGDVGMDSKSKKRDNSFLDWMKWGVNKIKRVIGPEETNPAWEEFTKKSYNHFVVNRLTPEQKKELCGMCNGKNDEEVNERIKQMLKGYMYPKTNMYNLNLLDVYDEDPDELANLCNQFSHDLRLNSNPYLLYLK